MTAPICATIGWDGQITCNTYTLVGRKNLLCSRHQKRKGLRHDQGQGIYDGISYERCTTIVVAVTCKGPHYLYSKRIWYMDPESACIAAEEMFDTQSRLWKIFVMNQDYRETRTGAKRRFMPGMTFIDLQRTHAGIANGDYVYNPKIRGIVKPTMFTIAHLQKPTEPSLHHAHQRRPPAGSGAFYPSKRHWINKNYRRLLYTRPPAWYPHAHAASQQDGWRAA